MKITWEAIGKFCCACQLHSPYFLSTEHVSNGDSMWFLSCFCPVFWLEGTELNPFPSSLKVLINYKHFSMITTTFSIVHQFTSMMCNLLHYSKVGWCAFWVFFHWYHDCKVDLNLQEKTYFQDRGFRRALWLESTTYRIWKTEIRRKRFWFGYIWRVEV